MNRRPHRPLSRRPRRRASTARGGTDDPVARDLAPQLMSSSPFGLLAYASGMVEAASPEAADEIFGAPMERIDESTFLELAAVESNAARSLMLAVATLVPDAELADELRDIIGHDRGAGFPPWIDEMGDLTDQRAFAQRHEQADGENIVITWRWPDGSEATYVGYVNFLVGYAITDGFAFEGDPRQVIGLAAESGTGIETIEIDTADARARLESAIETGRHFYPPFEAEAWPMSRPMLEWVLRSLPTGGQTYELIEWTEEQQDHMVKAFLNSDIGAQNWSEADAGLVELIIAFATGYGSCMPWSWSPQRAETFLMDFLPRKVFGLGTDQIDALPKLLRDMVVFAQTQTGVSDDTVKATTGAIIYFTREYVTAMHNPNDLYDEPDGFDDFGSATDDFDIGIAADTVLESLAITVGGTEALAKLDDAPLQPAPFDWSVVPGDLTEQTDNALKVLDGWAREYFDDEVVRIARVALAAVIAEDPSMLTRSPNAEIPTGRDLGIHDRPPHRPLPLRQQPGPLQLEGVVDGGARESDGCGCQFDRLEIEDGRQPRR